MQSAIYEQKNKTHRVVEIPHISFEFHLADKTSAQETCTVRNEFVANRFHHDHRCTLGL